MTATVATAAPDRCRRRAAWLVVLGVVAVHAVRAGSFLHGEAHRLYYSYASDVMIPVGAYFILYLGGKNLRFLRDRRARAMAVFGTAAVAEALQGLGLRVLGSTFDPVDLLCYGAGTAVAVISEVVVIKSLCRDKAVSGGPGTGSPASRSKVG